MGLCVLVYMTMLCFCEPYLLSTHIYRYYIVGPWSLVAFLPLPLLRNLSEQVGKGICPECLAGLDDCPYEDVRKCPAWKPTEGLEKPWDPQDPSPLLEIPHREFSPHLLFRKDPFHVYKQTIGGHWVASCVVLLMDLGYWSRVGQSTQADVLLEFACEDFNFYVKHEFQGRHVANIKNFTKALFHWHRIQTFPFGRFKGADCMLMVRWLHQCVSKGVVVPGANQRPNVSLIHRPLDPSHTNMLALVLEGCRASLQFWRVLHNEGTWHCRNAAVLVVDSSQSFSDCYSKLASQCHMLKLRRFHLEPTLHYMHHFAVDTQERLDLNDMHILSPNNDNCETDEDFVGRVSRLSRSVHALSIPQRTIQRYKIKAYFVFTGQDWGSSGVKRRGKKRKQLRPRQWKKAEIAGAPVRATPGHGDWCNQLHTYTHVLFLVELPQKSSNELKFWCFCNCPKKMRQRSLKVYIYVCVCMYTYIWLNHHV